MFSLYLGTRFIIYDDGSKFNLHFMFCNQFGIEYKPTTIKNPKASALLEHLHGVLGNMIHMARLQCTNDLNPTNIEQFIIDADWAVYSTHNTVLGSSPGVATFG